MLVVSYFSKFIYCYMSKEYKKTLVISGFDVKNFLTKLKKMHL